MALYLTVYYASYNITMYTQMIFAIGAAPVHNANYIPETVFWIWLHRLQSDVSNLTLLPEEDRLNGKIDRLSPSGRINVQVILGADPYSVGASQRFMDIKCSMLASRPMMS